MEKVLKTLDQRGEVYIKISKKHFADIKSAGRMMSIDGQDKSGENFYAYLNRVQYHVLKSKNIEFEILTPSSLKAGIEMCADIDGVKQWACYPTYNQYISLMQLFEQEFPGLCKLYEFGQSINGRKLLAVKISDNVEQEEEEPEFFYTSTMHGDETTGYVLMLRLIDYLLNNYDKDSRISEIINTTEIWINPLSNPDGTYYSGNTTVSGATRFNSNGIDLNRNFPDIEDPNGNPGQGGTFQQENLAMMDFLKNRHFVLSANFHGGAEVVNYPWDTWTSYEKKHADDGWYRLISREYADTVHANSTYYMTGFNNGITNGGDWYVITGGRQDYVNYTLRGREVTIEISDTKMPDPSQMPVFWEYNYRSFLNYIERVHTGVSGKVTDQFGNPVKANIFLKNYDTFNSDIFSDSLNGMYYRMLLPGTYQLLASRDGYNPAEFELTVGNGSQTILNIVLDKHPEGIETKEWVSFISNPVKENFRIVFEQNKPGKVIIELYHLTGQKIVSYIHQGYSGLNELLIPLNKLGAGIYICTVQTNQNFSKHKLVKLPD
jgi:hypothetical protein